MSLQNGESKLNIPDYEAYLKKNLSPKRFEHSIGVMKTMEELALLYGLDNQQAITAGLLHDIAKELTPDQWTSYLKDNELAYDASEYDYEHYLHGLVGAMLARYEFGIMDEEVLGAITTHGYYGPWEQFNRPLAWCLRMADILEPGRNWENNNWLRDIVEPMREATYRGRLREAASIITRRLIPWYEAIGLTIHPNIRRTANAVKSTH